MEPIQRFFWRIEERHRIFLSKEAGLPRGEWTDDEILKTYRFTNPFRENDKTTVWFRENMREPLIIERQGVSVPEYFITALHAFFDLFLKVSHKTRRDGRYRWLKVLVIIEGVEDAQ